MTNEERERVVAQLESLREHCLDMVDEADPDCIWNADVAALSIVIGELNDERERFKKGGAGNE